MSIVYNNYEEIEDKIREDLTLRIENKFGMGMPRYISVYSDWSLPFAYAKKVLKLKRPPRSNFDSTDLKFNGSLRPHQEEVVKEAVKRLSKTGSVIMSCHPGWGKTCAGIFMSIVIKMKTLIIVNKIVLMKQWEESIKKFCPQATVQRLTAKSKKKDCDFYIMNAQNVEKKGIHFWSNIGNVVVDECFPYKTPVRTPTGWTYIGDLMEGDDVISFDEKNKIFETQKVVAKKSKANTHKIVKVQFYSGSRKITCTENHPFLTTNGYVEALKLKDGDLIVSKYSKNNTNGDITYGLNSDQYQIILGSFLGDGNIQTLASKRYRMKIIHGYKQEEYCRWKANMFNCNINFIEKNGYNQTPAFAFSTKFFDSTDVIPSKKSIGCPQWLIDKIDPRGLAIWYMDDGSIDLKGSQITLSVCAFPEESVKRIAKGLERFNIKAKIFFHKYYYIKINKDSTIIFLNLIAPYIHDSMKYKLYTHEYNKWLLDQQKNIYDTYHKLEFIPKNNLKENVIYKVGDICFKYKLSNKTGTLCFHRKEKTRTGIYWRNVNKTLICPYNYLKNNYDWSNNFCNYGYLKVKKVEILDTLNFDKVYDIQVSKNHNFIVCSKTGLNGPVVHNCHMVMAETLSRSLQFVSPRYLIGLSATPYRPDGLDVLLDLYFGGYKIIRKLWCEHIVYKINTGYTPPVERNIQGRLNWGSILDGQARNKERNTLIADIISRHRDRKILVLVKRIFQGNYLEKILKNRGESVTSLLGKNQEFDKDARVLIGTCQKVGVGFDHPDLNTLILAADVEEYFVQYLGRVFRTKEVKPIIFDLVDINKTLEKHYNTRLKVYKEHGGTVKRYEK
jgi:superfamily II DNA or RNA helicase/intein/homing endonuclease